MTYVRDAPVAFTEIDFDTAEADKRSDVHIEMISRESFLTTMAILVLFLLIHGGSTFYAPPILATRNDFFHIDANEKNPSLQYEIAIGSLINSNRFISGNGSMVRKDVSERIKLPIELQVSYMTERNRVHVMKDREYEALKKIPVEFTTGNANSSSFWFFRTDVRNFDTIRMKVFVKADYGLLDGFNLHWTFANPDAARYVWATRLLLGVMLLYMLVIFAYHMTLDSEKFTQIFLLVLGILAIFAWSPFNIFASAHTEPSLRDTILMAMFVNTFRMFIMGQLELIRSNKETLSSCWIFVLMFLFVPYMVADVTAAYDREKVQATCERMDPVITPAEKRLMTVDSIYVLLSMISAGITVCKSDGMNSRRLGLVTLSVVVTGMITFVTHVVFVVTHTLMYSVIPSILFCSVHATFTSFFLFLLHCGSDRQYNMLGGGDDNSQSLDLGPL